MIKKAINKKKVMDFMCIMDDFSDSCSLKKHKVKAVSDNLKFCRFWDMMK